MSKVILVFMATGIILLGSYGGERLISYSSWNLAKVNQWIPTQALGTYGWCLGGGLFFLNERQTVARGKLNLSAWHGNHEVTLKDSFDFSSLLMNFELEKDAFLWIFLDQRPGTRRGLRLSRNKNFPSGYYELDGRGQIVERKNLALDLSAKETIRLRKTADDILHLESDGTEFLLGSHLSQRSVLTLKSGEKFAAINSIDIRSTDGKVHLDFSPPFRLYVFLVYVGIFLFMATVFFWISKAHRLFGALASVAVLATFILYFFALDYFFWSKLYPYQTSSSFKQVHVKKTLVFLEQMRTAVFGALPDSVDLPEVDQYVKVTLEMPRDMDKSVQSYIQWISSTGEIKGLKQLSDLALMKERRTLVFLGTSQLWGAGASQAERTGAAVLIRLLSEKYGPVDGLNLSICGGDIEGQLRRLEEILQIRQPVAVLANLGYNDLRFKSPVFSGKFKQLIALSRSHGIPLMVAVEPSFSIQTELSPRIGNVIVDLSQTLNVPFRDLRPIFSELSKKDVGFIWWDMVHFADLGHHIWANEIFTGFPWDEILRSPANGK